MHRHYSDALFAVARIAALIIGVFYESLTTVQAKQELGLSLRRGLDIYKTTLLSLGSTDNLRYLRIIDVGSSTDAAPLYMSSSRTRKKWGNSIALSYMWSDEPATEFITLNGRPFRIRHTLWVFLH